MRYRNEYSLLGTVSYVRFHDPSTGRRTKVSKGESRLVALRLADKTKNHTRYTMKVHFQEAEAQELIRSDLRGDAAKPVPSFIQVDRSEEKR